MDDLFFSIIFSSVLRSNCLNTYFGSRNFGSILTLLNPWQTTKISADTFLELGGFVASTEWKSWLNTQIKEL